MDIKNVELSGLMNLGNTCFLNSCLQIMKNTVELDTFLNNLKDVKNIEDAIILNEYNGLRKMMNSNNLISPKRFIYYIQQVSKKKGRTMFSGHEQNDMSEFLNFLLDCIHNSVSRPIKVKVTGRVKNSRDNLAIICYKYIKESYEKEYSEVMDIFYGIFVSEVKSLKGATYTCKPEYYSTIDLPLSDDMSNIYECFDLFTCVEEIEGYMNETTNAIETVYKSISFWNLPQILILCLKRFTNNIRKKHKVIDCPETIDLSKYVKGYRADNIYELYAVCDHIGNVHGGHYTCNIKQNGRWFHIDDETINVIRGPKISNLTYCLFYRKKNTSI